MSAAKKETILTLEKLEIAKDLQELKISIVRMIEKFDAHIEWDKSTHECLKKIAESHHSLLMGNESSTGIITQVDRLNQNEKGRAWSHKLLWTALVGLVGKMIFDFFRKGG